METLAIKLIEGLLEELSKTNSLSVSLAGPIRDSATVALPTFLGGLAGGPLGAFIGAAAGTGILGLSHAMGYGNYKPLMTALREDFTVEERNNLYERLWGRLSGFVVCPLNQAMAYSALTALTRTVENNPEVMENIRNELKETLSKKNMSLA
ncbi:uncharacterized protein LOC124313450 [Daphnia pulicaria]|uniref:uncharacterized protein LOC124313450 n=1 Tax=Daphnia pulicaria TaxID=35523 RepID=UPI001EEB0349|nr:uncharacterized protein LOC124313450 [Daphnia pulicaria]